MKRNLNDVLDILHKMKQDGINEITGEEFDFVVDVSINVMKLIKRYVDDNGNIALSCGSEWMYQDDDGQINGLELCGKILDSLNELAEYEDW